MPRGKKSEGASPRDSGNASPVRAVEATNADVLAELTALRRDVLALAADDGAQVSSVDPEWRDSATNLVHYLALRRNDLRPLQRRLAQRGLSSLGRAESCVLPTLDAVIHAVYALEGKLPPSVPRKPSPAEFETGSARLASHTDGLLGKRPPKRMTRIMVTMPSEAADDYSLVHELLTRGMDVMRINCAHDDERAWAKMIKHLRRAEKATGLSCRVSMDLAGPKLRTGPIESEPAVLKIRPARDAFGRTIAAARVWLTAEECPQAPLSPASAVLPVQLDFVKRIAAGDEIRLRDARDAKRRLRVLDVNGDGCWAACDETTYVVPGTELLIKRANDELLRGRVGELPQDPGVLLLEKGDLLVLTRDATPGRGASRDAEHRILTPATISCTLPEVFKDVRTGEPIVFDDGRIGGRIERVEDDRLLVRITRAGPDGEKLRGDKGINLPESDLRLPALTAKDLADLPFVAANADIVSLSFANRPSDVEDLLARLPADSAARLGIILKIETRRGFANLPAMLLTAMRTRRVGVMIARGDLAVECGFERLAEVQEEMLWVCEAAHVPVVWATQVLEALARDGVPSRAEITDAAMSMSAECVMLNKGPHIATAVSTLDDILRRMQGHHSKKRAMLRELSLARQFVADAATERRDEADAG